MVQTAIGKLRALKGDAVQMAQMTALPYLAEAELLLGDIASAASHSQEALTLALRTSNHEYEPRARYLLGICKLLEGESEQAATQFQAAYAMGCDLTSPGIVSRALFGLSRVAFAEGNTNLACKLATEAKEQAQICSASLLVADLDAWQAEIDSAGTLGSPI